LSAHADTRDVATVEDFYRPRYLYQLTAQGAAAERALAAFDDALRQARGELKTVALQDVHDRLEELIRLAAEPHPDPGKVHGALTLLTGRFEELTTQAQAFLASLQRTIDLQGKEVEELLAYKETLIDYLERFLGELVLRTPEIGKRLEKLDAKTVEPLLALAAERDLADAFDPSEADRGAALAAWRARWRGLAAWFLGHRDAPSQAGVLRARARSAIPALLAAVAGVHDRRRTQSDRATDLLALARWFAETDSDEQAHRLFRAAFGLAPARHLKVDEATLEVREAEPVPARTSWLEAPPLTLTPRLRRTGRHRPRGRPAGVIDRSRDKELLARLMREESEETERARRRLTHTAPVRLSELGELDPAEFRLFLDLLGQALAQRIRPGETVEASSSDGALAIRLAPTGDGRRAVIPTSEGLLSGEDAWVTIEPAFAAAARPGDEERAGGTP
jgi:uncharacterized protein (TIGR02677 family)